MARRGGERSGWRGVVEGSGLPREVRALVMEVVRRTRLWRSEKADLARELCAHFEDAIASGTLPEKAVRAFGDAKSSAALIRRGKRRQRGLVWQAWRRALQGAGLLLAVGVVVYAVQAVRYHTAKPVITRHFAAEHNAAIARIPEEERAWPLYREAILWYRSMEAWDPPQLSVCIDSEDKDEGDDERWIQACAYVQASPELLAMIRRAAARPHYAKPMMSHPDPELQVLFGHTESIETAHVANDDVFIFGILIPELADLRGFSRMLAVDTVLAAEERDTARVMDNLRAMIGVAGHVRGYDLLITELLWMSVISLAMDTVQCVLIRDAGVLPDESLREIAHRISILDDRTMHARVAGERRMFDDYMQRVYSDDGSGDGHLTAQGMHHLDLLTMGDWPTGAGPESGTPTNTLNSILGPVVMTTVAGRAAMVAEYGRLLSTFERETQKPYWMRDPAEFTRLWDRMESVWYMSRYPFIGLVVPAFGRVIINVDVLILRRDATLIAIALELYRRENGVYPADLQSLTPRFLPAVPRDRFADAPLRYVLRDGVPVVYSVAGNGVDDGGRQMRDRMGRAMNGISVASSDIAGDWVLYTTDRAALD